mmetsp:Transcript_32770/g.54132  ORF Transcript_32770/g.54132 Transcript_32770/m.54132 type:complete len:251 (-) Transcript_32770:778-1530(-)
MVQPIASLALISLAQDTISILDLNTSAIEKSFPEISISLDNGPCPNMVLSHTSSHSLKFRLRPLLPAPPFTRFGGWSRIWSRPFRVFLVVVDNDSISNHCEVAVSNSFTFAFGQDRKHISDQSPAFFAMLFYSFLDRILLLLRKVDSLLSFFASWRGDRRLGVLFVCLLFILQNLNTAILSRHFVKDSRSFLPRSLNTRSFLPRSLHTLLDVDFAIVFLRHTCIFVLFVTINVLLLSLLRSAFTAQILSQ